jgi:hypothetical protein
MTKLIPLGPGQWQSDDGRVEITLDHTFETECDEPHPVRYSMKTIETQFSGWFRESLLQRGTIRNGYLTYQCEGNESHWYAMWTVQVDGEWTPDVYEKFADARAAAEKIVGPMKLGRRPLAEVDTAGESARVSDAMKSTDQEVTMSTELHAVFATDGKHQTFRVSDPLSLDAAHSEWQRLDDQRREGLLPQAKFFEVRSVTLGPDRPLVGPRVHSHDRYDEAPLNMMMRS